MRARVTADGRNKDCVNSEQIIRAVAFDSTYMRGPLHQITLCKPFSTRPPSLLHANRLENTTWYQGGGPEKKRLSQPTKRRSFDSTYYASLSGRSFTLSPLTLIEYGQRRSPVVIIWHLSTLPCLRHCQSDFQTSILVSDFQSKTIIG